MTGKEIFLKRKKLEEMLQESLSTMEKKNDVKELREKIKNLSKECPHQDEELKLNNFNLNKCPYCGGFFHD